MNIAICEDNQMQLDLLEKFIKIWAQDNNVKVHIKGFKNAESFLFDWYEKKMYDAIFLDIQMSEMTGIELSKIIRKDDKNIEIIFTSGYTKYAVDGYDVNALRYLIKPLSEEKIKECLDIIHNKNIKEDKSRNIIIDKNRKSTMKVDCNDIIYCYMVYPFVYIQTITNKIEVRMKLSDLEELLSDKKFIKPHRSYLVNLKYISFINKNYLKLDNGEKVPISRLKFNEINEIFIKYFKEN